MLLAILSRFMKQEKNKLNDRSTVQHLINSKLLKITQRLKTKSSENFILEHNKLNNNTINDLSLYDEKRLVFVSLIGLFQTWNKCPSFLLYSALFILPLKKQWIYNPNKHRDEIMSHFVGEYISFIEGITLCSLFYGILVSNHRLYLTLYILYKYAVNAKQN